MITHTFALLACFAFVPVVAPTPGLPDEARVIAVVGGPPAIRIAGKASGDITAAQWSKVNQVELVGCVPGARITTMNICIKDCTGKNAGLNAKDAKVTSSMVGMVKNLPPGTPFTISVTVVDEKGKAWEVPPAKFVWKG